MFYKNLVFLKTVIELLESSKDHCFKLKNISATKSQKEPLKKKKYLAILTFMKAGEVAEDFLWLHSTGMQYLFHSITAQKSIQGASKANRLWQDLSVCGRAFFCRKYSKKGVTSTLFFIKIITLEEHSKCSIRMIRRELDVYGRLGSVGQRKKIPRSARSHLAQLKWQPSQWRIHFV